MTKIIKCNCENEYQDKKHRNKIISEAVYSFEACDIEIEIAEKIIVAIVEGKIKHITINY